MSCEPPRSTHHHPVDGDPAVLGEILQHGHEELEAAIPVTQQQHHPDQVHNAHHRASQIIGHVEDLQGTRGSRLDGSSPNNQPSIIRRSIGVKSLADVTGKAASAQLRSVTVREQSQL